LVTSVYLVFVAPAVFFGVLAISAAISVSILTKASLPFQAVFGTVTGYIAGLHVREFRHRGEEDASFFKNEGCSEAAQAPELMINSLIS
jgi:hypothetical protein